MNTLLIDNLAAALFAPFGDVLELQETPTVVINQGNCNRYTDLAQLDFSDGRAGISVFHAKPYTSPYALLMLERHPEGSQAFIPMSEDPFLVIVADDEDGRPGVPRVFKTSGRQGVNYHRGIWHAVLSPLSGNGLFTVVDRIGHGQNLEEYWFESAYRIEL